MEKSSGPGSQYSFVKNAQIKKNKHLLIVSIAFLILIISTLLYSAVSSFVQSGKKVDTVDKVFTKEDEEDAVKSANELATESYKNARIPYDDPQGRFSIRFVTPFVSDRIAVVINTDKDYDKVKTEADTIINEAKKKVPIQSVTYMNSFTK